MPRPLVLVFFFLLVAFTSQFEWKQRIVNGVEASPRIPQMHRQSKREESVKEKGLLQIILSQEKSIRKLADLVRSLREQLLQCKFKFKAVNTTAVPSTELLNELEQYQILDI
ncbi:uncharacterized protein LOC131319521 isoform X1 [Rhododendron vialii]|uniref:uncharacterized protein LOC131319521 isoform X1 n=1 Tax=Rhododendron vialii TaxID=182163 RepID=UPI00265F5C41|nr:uncharacterized protein LOC131319521 isoform X1 [Rhododendron vialii]